VKDLVFVLISHPQISPHHKVIGGPGPSAAVHNWAGNTIPDPKCSLFCGQGLPSSCEISFKPENPGPAAFAEIVSAEFLSTPKTISRDMHLFVIGPPHRHSSGALLSKSRVAARGAEVVDSFPEFPSLNSERYYL